VKHPLALRHLARLNEMVTTASIAHVAMERVGLDSPALRRARAEDGALAEEVQTLARERGWSLPEPLAYEWQLMTATSDPRPRVLRIVQRDVFELDGMARETDDDDVASLARQLCTERRALARELARDAPQIALPGAK